MEREDKAEKKHQSQGKIEKDNPHKRNNSSEGYKDNENHSNSMDEDLDAQKEGSYGHKSQDQAEKDGRE